MNRHKHARIDWVWYSAALALAALVPACSSSGDDDASAGAGASSGGSTQGAGGSAQGGSAGQAATVDCHAVCGQIKTLCASNAQIDDTWLSVCESACGARVQVVPDVAAEWQHCVNTAADCNAGVQCVATTSGSAGSK